MTESSPGSPWTVRGPATRRAAACWSNSATRSAGPRPTTRCGLSSSAARGRSSRPGTTWARGSQPPSASPPRARPASVLRRQRRGPARRGVPDAAGVALLLREHAPLAQPAQDHDRPGAGHGLRGGPDVDVVLRPHHGGRQCQLRRCGRNPAGDVRCRVLRPPLGVRSKESVNQSADNMGFYIASTPASACTRSTTPTGRNWTRTTTRSGRRSSVSCPGTRPRRCRQRSGGRPLIRHAAVGRERELQGYS